MVCPSTSTDPRRGDRRLACRASACARRLPGARIAGLVAWAVCALIAAAQGASAHEPTPLTTHEVVRLVGFFGAVPAGMHVERTVVLKVQGKELTLRATQWQVITLASEAVQPSPGGEPDRLTLQGTREQLALLASARAEQRVSILAERRPGRDEAFVVAVDLCPAD